MVNGRLSAATVFLLTTLLTPPSTRDDEGRLSGVETAAALWPFTRGSHSITSNIVPSAAPHSPASRARQRHCTSPHRPPHLAFPAAVSAARLRHWRPAPRSPQEAGHFRGPHRKEEPHRPHFRGPSHFPAPAALEASEPFYDRGCPDTGRRAAAAVRQSHSRPWPSPSSAELRARARARF